MQQDDLNTPAKSVAELTERETAQDADRARQEKCLEEEFRGSSIDELVTSASVPREELVTPEVEQPQPARSANLVADLQFMTHSLDLLRITYNYNHWIYSLLRPFLGEEMLEAGSGQGNITQFLLNRQRLICLEPEEEYLRSLERLADVHQNIELIPGCIADLAKQQALQGALDSVICLNVLEHIEDDGAAVRQMGSVLRPGGSLLLYVPACEWAFGKLDESLGHYRRYTKRTLPKVLRENGFSVVRCHYVNFIGAFAWCLESRILSKQYIDPSKARLMDRIVPFLSAAERLVRPPVGQSLFIVGVKE